MKILLIAFCCTYIFLGANCKEQFNHVGNPEQFNSGANSPVPGQAIPSEKDRPASHGPFDKLLQVLRENFEQALKFTLENLPKNKHATSGNQLPLSIFPRSKTTDLEKNGEERGEVASRKLNRRSLATVQAREDPGLSRQAFNPNSKLSPDPRVLNFFLLIFRRGRREDQQSYERQDNADGNPFKRIFEFPFKRRDGEGHNYPSIFNLMNFLFKNGPLDIFGLPGHPIRKMIEMFRQKMGHKEEDASEDQVDNRLLKKLFEHGKDVLDNLRKM